MSSKSPAVIWWRTPSAARSPRSGQPPSRTRSALLPSSGPQSIRAGTTHGRTLAKGDVEIDTCFNCKGVWLDAGELERIRDQGNARSGKVMGAVLNLFKRK